MMKTDSIVIVAAVIELLSGASAKGPSVLLHNAASAGIYMPATGIGTGGYCKKPGGTPAFPQCECWWEADCGENVSKAIVNWLNLGGERLDCANSYNNENTVGKAILQSGVKREDVFVTSKIGSSNAMGYEDTIAQAEALVTNYSGYVDLLLVHWPTATAHSREAACNAGSAYNGTECRLSTWRAMLEVWQRGLARAVGVSNYNASMIEEIKAAGLTLPAVDQCHYNPHSRFDDLLQYLKAHNILFNGYSPLGVPDYHSYAKLPGATAKLLDEPVLKRIAAERHATPAQVLLKWQWNKGLVVNPRTFSVAHMKENLAFFSVPLTARDSQDIDLIPQDECTKDSWYECVGPDKPPLATAAARFDATAPSLDFAVIDTHVHIASTTNGLDYLWAKDPGSLSPPQSCPCRPPCACNWTLADYADMSSKSWAVDKVVFCEVDVAPKQWLEEVEWVSRLSRMNQMRAPGTPDIGAIVAQPPPGFGSAPVATYARHLDDLMHASSLVRGLRPSINATSAKTPEMLDALREAGRRNLVIDMNFAAGIDNGLVHELVSQCPATRFVIEHMGGAPVTNASDEAFDTWAHSVRALAALSNVECIQLGGIMSVWGSHGEVDTNSVQKYVGAAINIFGFDRVCFEGNWFFNNWGPPHTDLHVYSTWAAQVKAALASSKATVEQARAVLRANAMRAYRID
eukprot:m.558318 g.558318  ORF g.558318 m.558318 type:complete len:687 (-) comp22198_c0_seq3:105-2165(-)